jgi:hypothetical protein
MKIHGIITGDIVASQKIPPRIRENYLRILPFF